MAMPTLQVLRPLVTFCIVKTTLVTNLLPDALCSSGWDLITTSPVFASKLRFCLSRMLSTSVPAACMKDRHVQAVISEEIAASSCRSHDFAAAMGCRSSCNQTMY